MHVTSQPSSAFGPPKLSHLKESKSQALECPGRPCSSPFICQMWPTLTLSTASSHSGLVVLKTLQAHWHLTDAWRCGLVFLKALYQCPLLRQACPNDHSFKNRTYSPASETPASSPFLSWTTSFWLLDYHEMMCSLHLICGLSSDVCYWFLNLLPTTLQGPWRQGVLLVLGHCSQILKVFITQCPLNKYLLNEQMTLFFFGRRETVTRDLSLYTDNTEEFLFLWLSSPSSSQGNMPLPIRALPRKHRPGVWRSWRNTEIRCTVNKSLSSLWSV